MTYKKCKGDGCQRRARSGLPGGKPEYCTLCRKAGMIFLRDNPCQEPGCYAHPSYNYPTETKGIFCKKHSLQFPGMIDVASQVCEHEGCRTRPSFGDPVERKRRYCAGHKPSGAVDLISKKCSYEGCNTQPNYNFIEYTEPVRCFSHKHPDMINIMSQKCEHPGCNLRPSYNEPGESRAKFCASHSDRSTMVNVRARCCEAPGCLTQPVFNFPGETQRRFCARHAKNEMIDVKSGRCNTPGCTKVALYNYVGENVPLKCYDHRGFMVNIKNKICEEPGCKVMATYGLPGHHPSHCAGHRTKLDVIAPCRRCRYDGCRELATYGIQERMHCEVHKQETEVDLVERRCVSCDYAMVLNQDNKCVYCDPTNFQKVRLAKQNEVKEVLDRNGIVYSSYDKVIDQAICGRERPDFVIEAATHVIVLEVDEHQHNDRHPECEMYRMINISQSFGGTPVIFLRYNPDTFKVGRMKIDTKKGDRYERLLTAIEYLRDYYAEPDYFLSVAYLFYDEYQVNEIVPIHCIMPFENETS